MDARKHARLEKWVIEILGPVKADAWWSTKNPMLGGARPCCYLQLRPDKLYRFVKQAREDNKTSRG